MLLCLSVPAMAGYTVVPMQFTLHAKPGETITRTMNVENMGNTPISLEISTKDFIKALHGEERQVEPGTVQRGCAPWIRFSPKKLNLAPHGIQTINFSMTIPMDGKGTYWGNILVAQISKPTLSKTIQQGKTSFQIFAMQDMLIRVLETVPGTEDKKGTITDISVKKPQSGGQPTIGVIFKNQGNCLLKCSGYIDVMDDNGQKVKTVPLESGHAPFTVYPGGQRQVYGHIGGDLPPGDYLLLTVIDYGGEDLVAGELEMEIQ
ncbi:conserved repeat domain-containing protein [Desulfocicer vacuolatum DSM 3385]|uniref:Conserved repeat domain-containing protein n=2 Tax=Desulfocicer vacuolatum TaxID=2298 RepID=A0A1W2AT63_9BACT|nr:conserved repeat domain-containing protein [Desulfocicer vacuolatum DSM 3385]